MTVILKWRRLDPAATLPAYMSPGASGMDIRACLTDPVEYPDKLLIIMAGQIVAIPTGLAVEIPIGYEMQIRPRSSISLLTKLRIPNSPGTIDADYRGEIKIIMENIEWAVSNNHVIKHGDRIAQIIIAPVINALNKDTGILTDTERGTGGFGSTGI